MKIELDNLSPDLNLIQAYGPTGILIKNTPYPGSLIVSPDRILDRWEPRQVSDLTLAHIRSLIDLSPEIVLLGTGKRLQFPAPEILAALHHIHIGVEVMDTAAACRAYNFIAGEGRRVIAALIAIES